MRWRLLRLPYSAYLPSPVSVPLGVCLFCSAGQPVLCARVSVSANVPLSSSSGLCFVLILQRSAFPTGWLLFEARIKDPLTCFVRLCDRARAISGLR